MTIADVLHVPLSGNVPPFVVGVLITVMLFRSFGWRLYADLRRAHGIEMTHYRGIADQLATALESERARNASDQELLRTQVTAMSTQQLAMMTQLAECRAESFAAKLEAESVRGRLADLERRGGDYRGNGPTGPIALPSGDV